MPETYIFSRQLNFTHSKKFFCLSRASLCFACISIRAASNLFLKLIQVYIFVWRNKEKRLAFLNIKRIFIFLKSRACFF